MDSTAFSHLVGTETLFSPLVDVSGSEEGRKERSFKHGGIEGSSRILSSFSQKCFVRILLEVDVEQRLSLQNSRLNSSPFLPTCF